MGSFLQSPMTGGIGQLTGNYQSSNPAQPQTMDVNSGVLQELRQIELNISSLGDTMTGIAREFPDSAEAARATMQALDAAKQALTGFVVDLTLKMQGAMNPRAPRSLTS